MKGVKGKEEKENNTVKKKRYKNEGMMKKGRECRRGKGTEK